MKSRIVSVVVLLFVAAAGVGLVVYVLQSPRDPEGPPPGFEIPDYTQNPPPMGPGLGDPARGDIDWKPTNGGSKPSSKGGPSQPADRP